MKFHDKKADKKARHVECSLAALLVSSLIAGCSGGGSGSSSTPETGPGPQPTAAVVTGTAASGAPLANATVTVVDAVGATRTTSTDVEGRYSIDVTALQAPLIFKAAGNVADARATFISMHPKTEAATVNVTPLTHAIAATLASTGQPLDLFDKILTEKGNVTAAAIDASERAIRSTLAGILNTLGAPTNTHLINTSFEANGTSTLR